MIDIQNAVPLDISEDVKYILEKEYAEYQKSLQMKQEKK